MVTFGRSCLTFLVISAAFSLSVPTATASADCPDKCRDNGDFHRDTHTGDGWEIGTFHSSYISWNCDQWEDHTECDGDTFVYDEGSAQLVVQKCRDRSAVTAARATAASLSTTALTD